MNVTNLIGRRARGATRIANPSFDAERRRRFGPEDDNQPVIDHTVEGDVVAVTADSTGARLCVWILDEQHQVRRLETETMVVVPRELTYPLRGPAEDPRGRR